MSALSAVLVERGAIVLISRRPARTNPSDRMLARLDPCAPIGPDEAAGRCALVLAPRRRIRMAYRSNSFSDGLGESVASPSRAGLAPATKRSISSPWATFAG